MESTAPLPRTEQMPVFAFKLMQWTMAIRDLFNSPTGKIDTFGIKPGQTVIDYGCGPGRYLRKTSQLVGDKGTVFAVDINQLAIRCACRIRTKSGFKNIKAVKATGYFAPIPEDTADVIYALDMFHQVSEPDHFLNELHRLLKPTGKLILEDGHQKRSKTLTKIQANRRFAVTSETVQHLILLPKFK